MRNKKLARLGGSPFSAGRVTLLAGLTFFPYKHFGSPNRVNSVKVTELREDCLRQLEHARALLARAKKSTLF